jgi:hypothetical protein
MSQHALETFHRHLQARGLRASTQETYVACLARLIARVGKEPASITSADAYAYLVEQSNPCGPRMVDPFRTDPVAGNRAGDPGVSSLMMPAPQLPACQSRPLPPAAEAPLTPDVGLDPGAAGVGRCLLLVLLIGVLASSEPGGMTGGDVLHGLPVRLHPTQQPCQDATPGVKR